MVPATDEEGMRGVAEAVVGVDGVRARFEAACAAGHRGRLIEPVWTGEENAADDAEDDEDIQPAITWRRRKNDLVVGLHSVLADELVLIVHGVEDFLGVGAEAMRELTKRAMKGKT
jgi:hypothetical protein